MRMTALVAALASVAIAGASAAGTPAAMNITKTENKGLVPITATFPPLSETETRQRCRGFVRAISVRHQLALALGQDSFDDLAHVSAMHDGQRNDADSAGSDFMTPYMVAFGPVNPLKTVRSGLFKSDRKTCSQVLDFAK